MKEKKRDAFFVSSLVVLQKIGRVRAEAVAMAFMAVRTLQSVSERERRKRKQTFMGEIYFDDFVDKRLMLRAISVCLLGTPRGRAWAHWFHTWQLLRPHAVWGSHSVLQLWGHHTLPARIRKIYSLSSRRWVFCPLCVGFFIFQKVLGQWLGVAVL